MQQTLVSNLDQNGEVRRFKDHGYATIGSAGAATFLKGTFEPGWRWSTDVAPVAGTTSCQVRHLGYVISGAMHIVNDDGTEFDIGAGDVFDLPAGHDAYVTSNEACVMVDISPDSMTYAKGATAQTKPKDDVYQAAIRKGYAAFNSGDLETLRTLFATDVVQHVPGATVLAGDYKGADAIFGMYGKIAELTDGTFRAHLTEVHSDGHGHAVAIHVATGTRNGVTRVSRGAILFTFIGERVTDLLQLRADGIGDDAFLS